jgi:hypothetical protein
MGYKIILKKYGISEENADEVMEWAFGEFWDMMDVRLTHLSFNNHHPELPPIEGKGLEIKDGLGIIAKHWLERPTILN